MKSKLISILLVIVFTLGGWSCKDVPPETGAGAGTSIIQGIVYDVNSNISISNAAVYLATSQRTDSMYTGTDGKYRFEVDLGAIQDINATLTVRKAGYISRSLNLSVARDSLIDIGLNINVATLAVIQGTIRDSSVYLYPLRNATVLLTLPGYVDSVVTAKEGTFRLTTDLVDRDSLQVVFTVFKTGYRTKRFTFTIFKGLTTDLGDVLLAVDKASTVTQVFGRVFDDQSKLPITNARVTLVSNLRTDSVFTSFSGDYSFSIDLQGLPSLQGFLKVDKNGYKSQSATFSAEAGKMFSQDFYIVRDTTTAIRDTSATSLYARSIAFMSMTAREISVYGVGGTESTILTWEVRDSLGFPIDLDHRDTVEFLLIGTPVSGGAYVTPERSMTNASGRVATTVNSGTVSGELQFVASLRRDADGVVIRSTPIIIVVNAGLPDQSHFTLGAERYNFPAYDWLGRRDIISALVGDKYTNPVKMGTAVYFNSTGGVIEAAGFTDQYGFTKTRDGDNIILFSGNPRPSDPILGPGFAHIAAMTRGEDGVLVTDTIVILFSATSMIRDVSADTFSVPRGGASERIYFTVSDRFGNPLSSGTHIGVSLQYTPPPNSQVNLVTNGDVDVTLDDVITSGPGHTRFWFQVVDQTIGGVSSRIPVTAVIRVTSENGNPPPYSVSGYIGN